jgi:hypothetical protein
MLSSQKVLSSPLPSRRHSPAMIWHSREDLEIWLKIFAQRHDRSDIPATIAVIRSRPNGHDVLRGKMILIPFVDELMCSSNQLEIVDVVELPKLVSTTSAWSVIWVTHFARDLVSKQPTCATRTNRPRLDFFWVTPYKVAEGAFVWNLLSPGNDTDLVKSADFGAETSVDAEHFAVDDSCEGEEIEDLTARLPDRGVAILLLALLIESVDLRNLP